MAEIALVQTFNDDLLANADDVGKADKLYPGLIRILDYPELRKLFKDYDDPANAAKRRSYRMGVTAVVLGAIALLMVASELVIPESLNSWKKAVVIASLVFAVVSLLAGWLGLLRSNAKHEWLHRRLMTERLRQFHFHTLICRMSEIAAAQEGGSALAAYLEQRELWFSQFRNRFEGKLKAELNRILDSDETLDFWLHGTAPPTLPLGIGDAAATLFAAYRELRIGHQLQFATYKLRESEALLPSSPRSQAAAFSNASLICILAVFLLHVGIGIGALWGLEDLLMSHWLQTIAIAFAIVALAIRALEEGLKPEREAERYQHYKSAINAIRDRFDHARTAHDKFEMMKEMERLAFDEMCDFMRTHARARFVM